MRRVQAGSRSATARRSERKASPMAGSAASASQKVWPMRSAESVGWPSRAATRWATADSRVSWLRIIVRMKLVSDGSWRIAASAS